MSPIDLLVLRTVSLAVWTPGRARIEQVRPRCGLLTQSAQARAATTSPSAASASGDRAHLAHEAEVVADRTVSCRLAVRDSYEVTLTPSYGPARAWYAE